MTLTSIKKIGQEMQHPPTCWCLVCHRRENQNSDIVDAGKAWLCDRCRAALLKVVESEERAQDV